MSAIIGNKKARNRLETMLRKGSVGNSLLFAGPPGVGKGLIAHEFGKDLVCCDDAEGTKRRKADHGNHPDIHVYHPEGKTGMHSMDSMRAFSKEVYMCPNESARKVFIIHDAHRMLPTSANALLKTFEEPTEDSLIILVSSEPEALLPTIRSRCRTVRFEAIDTDTIRDTLEESRNLPRADAEKIAKMSHGSLAQALDIAENGPNPKRLLLLSTLAHGQMHGYQQLSTAVEELAELVEKEKSEAEEELREQYEETLKDAPAAQKEALNKEIDGAVTLRYHQTVNTLLEVVLSWYRDLHALKVETPENYILNSDEMPLLIHALETGRILPIEQVQRAVSDAQLAIQRAIKFRVVLENLFLKLNFL